MLRSGDWVSIEGLPKGKDVVFREESEGYDVSWKLDDNAATSGSERTVVLPGDATLAVTNTLEPVSPTGLEFATAPFLWLFGAGSLLTLPFLTRRRRREEVEEE